MISICVADNQLWVLWLNDGYQYECWSAIMDYMAHICMIIICITPLISMWLLTINSNQCEWLAISVYVWQSEYVREYVLHTKQKKILFLFITQIILIVFLVVKYITYMMSKILSIINV